MFIFALPALAAIKTFAGLAIGSAAVGYIAGNFTSDVTHAVKDIQKQQEKRAADPKTEARLIKSGFIREEEPED